MRLWGTARVVFALLSFWLLLAGFALAHEQDVKPAPPPIDPVASTPSSEKSSKDAEQGDQAAAPAKGQADPLKRPMGEKQRKLNERALRRETLREFPEG